MLSESMMCDVCVCVSVFSGELGWGHGYPEHILKNRAVSSLRRSKLQFV